MTLPACMKGNMRLPLIGSPMFLVSHPELVLAQCLSGVVGAFPSLNARPLSQLDEWLTRIGETLAREKAAHPDRRIAPFAVNLIVHRSNTRLEEDLELVVKHKVPLVITSLGARADVMEAIHSYGGEVLHDVVDLRFAEKALEKGADGLIAVAAGAGGHAGRLSPIALVQEIRAIHQGPLFLSGAMSTGDAILAAQAMGADGGYMGSAFIACDEAAAVDAYKDMIVASHASDIVYSNLFTGVHGNYLAPSITAVGMDPQNLPEGDLSTMDFGAAVTDAKAWRDIWGAGQGVGGVKSRMKTVDFIDRLALEYAAARKRTLQASSAYITD